MDAYLFCESGEVFRGEHFGALRDAVGELVFETAEVGCPEDLTDPRWFGQIVCGTFPLQGNYGIVPEAEAAVPVMGAFVVREWCAQPSNFRCSGTLDEYLTRSDIAGICGVDTRRLTRLLRAHGPMNALVTKNRVLTAEQKRLLTLHGPTGAVAACSIKAKEDFPAGEKRAALLDLGARGNIVSQLNARGCGVTVYPFDTPAELLLEGADAIVLSPGPGDPAECAAQVAEIKKLISAGVPILALGLGHELLALAAGGEVYRMPCGHRGANLSVRDTQTGRARVTCQNHGWAVAGAFDGARASYINVNDDTVEGLVYTDFPAQSLQFLPETAAGTGCMGFIYDELLKGGRE